MLVVADTNALLLPFTDGTDLVHELEGIFGAVELVVPSVVDEELATLMQGQGATARAAAGAKRMLAEARREATTLPGDDGVLDVARRLGAAILSNDKRLLREAKRSGLPAVQSRGHGRLHLA